MSNEQRVEVDAVELKTVEIRLNGIKESTHRSRFIFIVLTIVTSAILITLWNATLSWDLGLVQSAADPAGNPSLHSASGKRASFIAEWIKNLIISVGLLGIRVSSNDLAVIGSASLIVVMTWYFYSQRRENRAIVSLLQDCAKGYKARQLSAEVCYMVFQGIVHSLVFIDLGQGDVPLSGLMDDEKSRSRNTFLVRKVVKALAFLAPVTIVLIIISDTWSLGSPSPLRDPQKTLWANLTGGEQFTAIIFESFAALSAIYTWYLCQLSRRFSAATTETLKEYETFLEDPEGFLWSGKERPV